MISVCFINASKHSRTSELNTPAGWLFGQMFARDFHDNTLQIKNDDFELRIFHVLAVMWENQATLGK